MRYMNPGYVKLLSKIVDNSGYSPIQSTDPTQTKTGVGILFKSTYNYISFDFPASGEIYCRFDFYYRKVYSSFYLDIGEYHSAGTLYGYNTIKVNLDSSQPYFYASGKASSFDKTGDSWDDIFNYGKINSALFHLKWADSEPGLLEVIFNKKVFLSTESEDFKPRSTTKPVIFCINCSDVVSNIIISDEPISIKEQLVALPISSVATDMTYDSETGLYTASAVNQSLLASVDVADLISNFGSASKVTGVAIVGNPAYRTAEGLASFTALTKKNNTVNEYSAANIPTDTDSVVTQCFKVASDTTVGDFANMQIGLRVGD